MTVEPAASSSEGSRPSSVGGGSSGKTGDAVGSSERRNPAVAELGDRPAPGRGILLRVGLLVIAVAAVYLLFQRASHWLFAPELEVLEVVTPEGELPLDRPAVVRAWVTNDKRVEGSAFAVIAFPGGELIEGPTVAVPRGDTVDLPVAVSLGRGEHVVSLVVFSSWRGLTRVASTPGIVLRFGAQEIRVEEVALPPTVRVGEPLEVRVGWFNPSQVAEELVPVLVFRADAPGRETVTLEAPAARLGAGEQGVHTFTVSPTMLEPGLYFVELLVRRPEDEAAGGYRYPIPVEIVE